MKSFLIPVVLLLLGSGAGVGAGLFLAAPAEEPEEPAADPAACTCPPADETQGDSAGHSAAEAAEAGGAFIEGREYVRLNNQFVVPVVEGGSVTALVVLSLSVEVTEGSRERIFSHEPKLRDAFLQVLFDHANIGGFAGNFTSSSNMRVLREALRTAARGSMGDQILDVLIIDIVRQDIQDS